MSRRPCGDPLGACLYAGPHEGPHKVAPGHPAIDASMIFACPLCPYKMWDPCPDDISAHFISEHVPAATQENRHEP